jgi:hypothetical protein
MAAITLPKYHASKTIYTSSTCCNKPIRFIPTVEFRVLKDTSGQVKKSADASLSLRRTNLIKRVVKDTILDYGGLKFVACIARPIPHPDGREAYKLDGVIEYPIVVSMPDTANKADISSKLEAALQAHGIDILSIESCTGRHQFKIHVQKIVAGEKE